MVLYVCVGTLTLWLLGCSGTRAAAEGMCSTVRRLLIGYFMLLSGRLYCCSSQRKSRGERIISQLIPTLLISHHSTPTAPYLQACQCLFFVFFILGYKLPVSPPPPLPDSPALSPLFSRRIEQEAERESTCCEIPRRRWWHFSFPPARENRGWWRSEKEK